MSPFEGLDHASRKQKKTILTLLLFLLLKTSIFWSKLFFYSEIIKKIDLKFLPYLITVSLVNVDQWFFLSKFNIGNCFVFLPRANITYPLRVTGIAVKEMDYSKDP